jgi:hypothetical protein
LYSFLLRWDLFNCLPVFLSLFWGLFDFSLLRTHFCLITKYSVEFRAALRGNFARGAYVDEDAPKGGPGSDNSAFRMTLAGRMPVTLVLASSASATAQRPVRYLIFDEVSRFSVQSKGRVKEGHPLALSKVRQTTRLAITVAGYVHFPLAEQAGFDQEFFAQLLSERKEKRKRLGCKFA